MLASTDFLPPAHESRKHTSRRELRSRISKSASRQSYLGSTPIATCLAAGLIGQNTDSHSCWFYRQYRHRPHRGRGCPRLCQYSPSQSSSQHTRSASRPSSGSDTGGLRSGRAKNTASRLGVSSHLNGLYAGDQLRSHRLGVSGGRAMRIGIVQAGRTARWQKNRNYAHRRTGAGRAILTKL